MITKKIKYELRTNGGDTMTVIEGITPTQCKAILKAFDKHYKEGNDSLFDDYYGATLEKKVTKGDHYTLTTHTLNTCGMEQELTILEADKGYRFTDNKW